MNPRAIRFVALAAAVGAGAAIVATAVPASAAPVILNVNYDVNGTTVVAKPNSTVRLGPTVLSTHLANDGSFTAQLPIPSTTSEFKVIGLLPVKATVNFIPVGDTTGQLSSTTTRVWVNSTSRYYIKLTNVTLAGLPTFVGNKCQTSAPVTIAAGTPANESFNVLSGGHLTGTYTIGKFANCGLTTGIVNLLVPGTGNTLDLTLSNGRLAS